MTSRKRFIEAFGKPIEQFATIQQAVRGLRESTTNQYYRELPQYFLFLKQDPDTVIATRKQDVLGYDVTNVERYEKLTKAYINFMLEKGKAGRTVQGALNRVQGFFTNNARILSLDIRKKPKIPKARKNEKYTATNEEVRHIYSIADSARDRLIIALMYQNGPAPVDVSAINVGDLPTEPWTYYEKARSKTGEPWRAVVTPDIVFELKAYLKIRGNPKANGPLFIGRRGPLSNKALSEVVSDLITKAELGNGFKPTSLRDAFEDALVEANVNHKIKEALMGHSGDIEMQYGGTKKLRMVCVEAMKKAYPLLSLNGYKQTELTAQSEIEELKTELEKARGLTKQLIESQEEIIESQEEIQKKWEHLKDLTAQAMVFSYLQKPPELRDQFLKGLKRVTPELFENGRFDRILKRVTEEL
jgi:integrase